MSEKVSILMPCYNAGRYIDQAIESVANQSYPYWELIIVDDCSTDDTRQHIKRWQKQEPKIKSIFLEANHGAAYARNKGLEIASGRYIALLDSDDLWHKEKLESQLVFMQSNEAPLTFTSYQHIDENGDAIADPVLAPAQATYRQMLNNSVIGCPTAVYDTAALGKVEMPNVFHADYATWLKILRMGHVAHGLSDVLAYYRIRNGSINRNKVKAAWHRWRVYRDCESYPLIKSLRYIANYTYHGIKKSFSKLPRTADNS